MLSFHDMSAYPDSHPSENLFFRGSYVTLETMSQVIEETCAALPLEQHVFLDVSNVHHQMEEQTWLKRFGKLARLMSIRVEGFSRHLFQR